MSNVGSSALGTWQSRHSAAWSLEPVTAWWPSQAEKATHKDETDGVKICGLALSVCVHELYTQACMVQHSMTTTVEEEEPVSSGLA